MKQAARPSGQAGQDSDDARTAFPASAATPGQADSRSAYQAFAERRESCPWWSDYLELRQEGWDWRKAAYIAWAASPVRGRWPATQAELATDVLGLRSDRTIQKWREKSGIEDRVETLKVEPLLKHRRDVIEALCEVAARPEPNAHSDRKLFLEMTGDYQPKAGVSVTGKDGGPIGVLNFGELSKMSDAELDQLIKSMKEACREDVESLGRSKTASHNGAGAPGNDGGGAVGKETPADVFPNGTPGGNAGGKAPSGGDIGGRS